MKSFFCFALVFVLAGCASLDSRVTRFHRLTPQADGSFGTFSFYIPDDKTDSLEFNSNVALVKAEMKRVGFSETSLADAEYVALWDYSSTPSGSTSSYTVPMQASGGGAFAKGFNMGAAAGGGVVSTSSTYMRVISFRISKFGRSTHSKPETVYESRLLSEGSTANISAIMPQLVKSMFDGFPGKDGETKHVTVPMQ